MIGKLLSVLLLAVLSSVAFANSCPLLMKDIDMALENPAVEERLGLGQLTKVRELRLEGEEAHEAGDHERSMKVLGQAKEILGIS